MTSLLQTRPTANATADPFEGTDDYRYELGPDPDDARWWAEQSETSDDDGPDDAEWDRRAAEYVAADALCRGLLFG